MAPSDSGMSSDQAFQLKLIFLRELDEGYREARTHQGTLFRAPDDPAALAFLSNFFHRIAGTGHAVELPLLGHLSSVCEQVVQHMLSGALDPPEKGVQILADGIEGIGAVLRDHGSRSPPLAERPKLDIAGMTQPTLSGDERALSKILVIDDDPFAAAMIDSCLRLAGFMSSFSCEPEAALKTVLDELPDLVILDVMMPRIDGFELCRRIREHPALSLTPVIFVTRKGDVEQRVRGLAVGGNDYIAKPFEPQELVARVRSHLSRLSALRDMAIRDGLTRAYNHNYFKTRLEQEVLRARRYKSDLSLAMLDIDLFKGINDTYGHPAGDAVLAHLSNLVHAVVRATDVVARYGGEEFGIIFVQAGSVETHIIANRLRERVASHRFNVPSADGAADLRQVPVTVSIGVAQFAGDDGPPSLIKRADVALYQAKSEGRNCVRVSATP